MAVAGVRPREISNSRYRMFQRLRVRSLLFRLRKGPASWHSPPSPEKNKKGKNRGTSLSPSIFLVHKSVRGWRYICVSVCDRFRCICNILFCIENDLGAIPRYACPLNRTLYLSFPCIAEVSFVQSRVLPVPPSSARSWQAATGEDDLSLYFPGRSSSSNKGILFFSFSFLPVVPHPPLFSLLTPSLPSSSIWRGLLFLLSLSLIVFLLNDRPFTAVSDGVARRFP